MTFFDFGDNSPEYESPNRSYFYHITNNRSLPIYTLNDFVPKGPVFQKTQFLKLIFLVFPDFLENFFLDIFNHYFTPFMFLWIINRPHLSYKTKIFHHLVLNLQKNLCIRIGNIPYSGVFSFQRISACLLEITQEWTLLTHK